MRIYIDISVLTLATFITGIQRVTREICVRFIEKGGASIYLMHYNAAKNVYYRVDNAAFCDYYLRHKGIKEKMITGEMIHLQEIDNGSIFFDLDAAWMCRMKRSYLLPILKKQGARIVAHIYDVISITHPQYCLERGVYNFMDYIGAHLLYADEMIVNADATADEIDKLAENAGQKRPLCKTVPLGGNFRRNQQISEQDVLPEIAAATKTDPYVLMVGTIEPRKNHKLLIEAYDLELKKMGYRIIFAGALGWKMENFEQKLKEHPDFGTGIFHFQGLDDHAISYLYDHAEFLAFCSYTEGFGLPIIESICRGTPVLAADIPVSREVAGDYCVWFEQDNARDLCGKVREYRNNKEKYDELKKKMKNYRTVSWEESAEKMWDALGADIGIDR